jgi:hypothetical protein
MGFSSNYERLTVSRGCLLILVILSHYIWRPGIAFFLYFTLARLFFGNFFRRLEQNGGSRAAKAKLSRVILGLMLSLLRGKYASSADKAVGYGLERCCVVFVGRIVAGQTPS